MKLQGKKTGAFANFVGYIDQATPTIDLPTGNTMLTVRYMDAGVNCYKDYKTIAEFNKDWEDYAVEEPLIKDKKVRKAVRAWFDFNQPHELFVVSVNRIVDEKNNEIKFSGQPFCGLVTMQPTITKLCGEEEE